MFAQDASVPIKLLALSNYGRYIKVVFRFCTVIRLFYVINDVFVRVNFPKWGVIMDSVIKCDICVVGLGSGGFGAAYAAAHSGLSVVGVEKNSMPGGTSVFAGVNSWERGVGGIGVHYKIYEELKKRNAVSICSYTNVYRDNESVTAFVEKSPSFEYHKSLRRHHGGIVTFEPEEMADVMHKLLADAGVNGLYNTDYVSCEMNGDKIDNITVRISDSGDYIKIKANVFIDCTADIYLTKDSGCEIEFDTSLSMNSVSQMFRITRKTESFIDPLPDFAKEELEFVKKRKSDIIFNEYPSGDYNGNPLTLMDGIEYYNLPSEKRLSKARAQVYAFWYYLQTVRYELRHYRIKSLFPRIGIREGARLVGKYVLTIEDVRAGYLKQNKKEQLIAFADHAVDNHASDDTEGLKELEQPYGIPYECLLPKEVSNLLVACRGSSFSKTAATSCRLSRTMMSIGEAAGTAAAQAISNNISVGDVKPVTVIPQEVTLPRIIE